MASKEKIQFGSFKSTILGSQTLAEITTWSLRFPISESTGQFAPFRFFFWQTVVFRLCHCMSKNTTCECDPITAL